jgi:hypothetical protein
MLPTVCYFSLAVHVFYLSVACYFIACLFLIPCMLVTSLLHVTLVVCTHYFSHIYQSSLFLCSIYAAPLSTCFFASVLLVAYYFIYSVDWTGKHNVLVRSFF